MYYLYTCVDPIGWHRIVWSAMVDVSLAPPQNPQIAPHIILLSMACPPLPRESRGWEPVGGDQDEQGGEDHKAVLLQHHPNVALCKKHFKIQVSTNEYE